MKKILILIIAVLPFNYTYAQEDCVDIPSEYLFLPDGTGNTGVNMTIMLTEPVISSLPLSDSDAYMVAFTPLGLLVGSTGLTGDNLQEGGTTLSIWGDDSSTPESIDGAEANEPISLQIVDGSTVYDYTPDVPIIYNTNGLSVVLSGSISLHCGGAVGSEIEFQIESSGWNMLGFTGPVSSPGQ